MGIDPRDYDMDALRDLAEAREMTSMGEGEDPEVILGSMGESDKSYPDNLYRSAVYRELIGLKAGDDQENKPYLSEIPDKYSGERLIFDWLEFLMMQTSDKRVVDVLGYYESLGWISEEVKEDLKDYLMGINVDGNKENEFDFDDHMLSLVYIGKINSLE